MNNQQAIKHNLAMELSECIEGGNPVCATGRFTRIIDTLNGVDGEVAIKPKWAISQELIERAKTIQSNELARLDKSDREAFESLTRHIKGVILIDFKNEYVDSGILTREALDVETLKWIDHIG